MEGEAGDRKVEPPGFVNHILLNKNRVSNLNARMHAGVMGNGPG